MAAGIVQLVAAVRNGHTEGSNKRLLFVVGALYSLHARGLWGGQSPLAAVGRLLQLQLAFQFPDLLFLAGQLATEFPQLHTLVVESLA